MIQKILIKLFNIYTDPFLFRSLNSFLDYLNDNLGPAYLSFQERGITIKIVIKNFFKMLALKLKNSENFLGLMLDLSYFVTVYLSIYLCYDITYSNLHDPIVLKSLKLPVSPNFLNYAINFLDFVLIILRVYFIVIIAWDKPAKIIFNQISKYLSSFYIHIDKVTDFSGSKLLARSITYVDEFIFYLFKMYLPFVFYDIIFEEIQDYATFINIIT